jgi:hypothetical protein
VVDSTLGNTESDADPANKLYVDLITEKGTAHEAACNIGTTEFKAFNLAAACGQGFTRVPGTPVSRPWHHPLRRGS